ncbi:MAG: response regulator [Acidobacteria bacterium]|nr:MAG: response regulator [Acidobacteriota bacterium]REK07703.1 MAG: response regulator [Acidobacteriota bacterium]
MNASGATQAIDILLADDDPDDRLFAREALEESLIANRLHCVEDGEELLEFLRREGRYSPPAEVPRPGLILLDLNMPRVDGRAALAQIKSDPELRRIPVVVMTTSRAEEDVLRSYDLGVNSFISKPVTFGGLVEVMRNLGHYWLQIVSLPSQ